MTIEFWNFLIRLFGDFCPKVVDALVLAGETPSNEMSVLNRAFRAYHACAARFVVLTGVGPIAGYRGFTAWKDHLVSRGINEGCIIPAGTAEQDVSNCYTEGLEFVKLAQAEGWKDAIMVAPHFHLPRVFMTTASAVIREGLNLKLYAMPGEPLAWNEDVVHNQGIVYGTRLELLESERQRISEYAEKGDIFPVNRILAYLEARDSIPATAV